MQGFGPVDLAVDLTAALAAACASRKSSLPLFCAKEVFRDFRSDSQSCTDTGLDMHGCAMHTADEAKEKQADAPVA